MLIAFLLCCQLERSVTEVAIPNHVIALEQAVLDARRRLVSGVVEIEASLARPLGAQVQDSQGHWIYYFDGDQLRRDTIVGRADEGDDDESVSDVIAYSGEVLRTYHRKQLADGGRLITSSSPAGGINAKHWQLFDPRLLGFHTGGVLAVDKKLDSHVGQHAWLRNISLSSEKRQGTSCAVIKYDRENRYTKVWVSTEQDHNIVALEVVFGPLKWNMDAELAQVDGFGWFPSEVRTRRFKNNECVADEKAVIRVRQLNQPVDRSMFQFSGMGVPEGETIYDSTTGETIELEMGKDGTQPKLSFADSHRKDISTSSHDNSQVKKVLIINSCLFASIAVVLVWRNRRPKPGTAVEPPAKR